MKKELSEINVLRIGHSPYFKATFLTDEKNLIESIKGVTVLPSSIHAKNEDVSNVDVVITNTHVSLDALKLESFKKVKLIIHSNSGYDNFSFDFVKNFKGQIVLGNSIRQNAVTNYILSALFDHYSRLPLHSVWDKKREWNRDLLSEKKLLLIGFGHIGSTLAHILKPLVSELRIYDPFQNLTKLELNEIDIVIPVCGLNQTTHHLINYDFLSKIKPNFLLINASRGEVVKTSDLVSFMEKNHEASAYLDVFESEPNNFGEFEKIANIHTTSHIAGVFKNIDQETIIFERNVIEDFLTLETNQFTNKYAQSLLKNKLAEDYLI